MPNKAINLQDSFLNQVRKENVPVTIHLVNGFQIKGSVRGFDNFTVVLDVMGKQQMVYKHAISSIVPARPLPQHRQVQKTAAEDGSQASEQEEEVSSEF